jgi:hypothetical protein
MLNFVLPVGLFTLGLLFTVAWTGLVAVSAFRAARILI